MNRRVFCVGIDGAPDALINSWAERFGLKTISHIISNGAHGVLESTVPALTAPAWASFLTGLSPANTGVYEFVHRDRGSYNLISSGSKDISGFALWDYLDSAGIPSCFINVPMTYPVPKKPLCCFTAGLLAYDTKDPAFVHPSNLFEETGFDRSGYEITFYPSRCKNESEISDRLMRLVKMRASFAEKILNWRDWGFFMVHFYATDLAQHVFYHSLDEMNNRESIHKNPVTLVYQFIDDFIAKLSQRMKENDVLLICSDHGFGKVGMRFNINTWLEKQGWLTSKITLDRLIDVFCSRINSKITGNNTIRRMETRGSKIYSAIPYLIREVLDSASLKGIRVLPEYFLLEDRFRLWSYYDWTQWGKTYVYTTGSSGGLYLNLQGREPYGIIPSSEYKSWRKRIINELESLKDQKGDCLIEKVLPREEVYQGRFSGQAPDIVCIAQNPLITFNPSRSDNILDPPGRMRTGDHNDRGMVMIYGDNIKCGEVKNTSITDIAPTILSMLGILPVSMDGDVIKDAFINTEFLSTRQKIFEPVINKRNHFSKNDDSGIINNLKALGYMG